MQLHLAIDDYRAHQACRGGSVSHWSEVRRILRALEAELDDPEHAEITPSQLCRFLGAVRSRLDLIGQKRMSDHKVFAYHRRVAASFTDLEGRDLLVSSPMRRIPRPRVLRIRPPAGSDRLRACAGADWRSEPNPPPVAPVVSAQSPATQAGEQLVHGRGHTSGIDASPPRWAPRQPRQLPSSSSAPTC